MCESDSYITLTETENCQITYCKECRAFSIAYSNCCASFTPGELNGYKQVLESLHDRDYHYNLLGRNMAIVKNPHVCVGFCLDKNNVKELLGAIREAETLFEVFKIIY